MRALFFGSPAFAVPSLDALTRIADVACVFTQPDRPAGRGLKPKPPEVKVRAEALGLRVEQPTKVRTAEFAELVRSFDADVALVVAYGRILTKSVLEAPRVGCINVHGSLLPRWRGAAPIQWAVASGDRMSGVTLMQMDEGLDTGPSITSLAVEIGANETSQELADRLSVLGAELVERDLEAAVRGDLPRVPQPEEGVTYASLLEKTHGKLDFASAQATHDRTRGMTPWPGAYAVLAGEPLKLFASNVLERSGAHGPRGTVLGTHRDALAVACEEGVVGFREVQESGRKRVTAAQFLAGRQGFVGTRLVEDT
jgi:methionyl-tRNA formyltransferase